MREIIFDTETTGLDPKTDRIIEIGAAELKNHLPTGVVFQAYINPQRSVPLDSSRVHGLTDSFLADKPLFEDAIHGFLDFIGDDPLIAHNASFDFGVMNAELARIHMEPLDHARKIDTIDLAKKRFPTGYQTLDAISQKLGVDPSRRKIHGALIDSVLLAEIYIELIGGRQETMFFDSEHPQIGEATPAAQRPSPRHVAVADHEIAAHRSFMSTFKTPPIWRDYQKEAST